MNVQWSHGWITCSGRSHPLTFHNHVRTKFATPILYAKDNLKKIYIYITIDSIFYMYFWIIFSSSFFVVIGVVRFCINLVRNGMFYKKHKSSYLVTIFYYVIDNMYIYFWKNKLIKNWPILVMQLRQTRFILVARGVQLDNRVHHPWLLGTIYFALLATAGCIAICYNSTCNVAFHATWLPHLDWVDWAT